MKLEMEHRISPNVLKSEISALSSQLSHKEKEFEKANREIHEYRLEIENKEETLTRFFHSPSRSGELRPLPSNNLKNYKIKKTRNSMNVLPREQFKFGSEIPLTESNYKSFGSTPKLL